MSHAYKRVRRGTIALAMLLALMVGRSSAQWVEGPPVPQGRVLAQQAYANGKIFVFGGSTASVEIPFGSYPTSSVGSMVLLNSPGGTSWSAGSAMSVPRVGGYAAMINGKIYIVGGHSNVTQSAFNFTPNVLEFDPATNSYIEKAAMITPVTGAACAAIGTKIYCFGGLSLNDQGQLVYGSWAQVYDVTTNSWQQLSVPAPYAQFYGTAVANGQSIYLIGGSTGNNVSRNVYKATEQSGGLTWSKLKDYPFGVASAAAGVMNGKIYVAGGMVAAGATNKVYRYDEAGNNWETWYALPIAVGNVNSLVWDGTSLFYISGSNNNKTFKLAEGTAVPVAAVDQNAIYVTVKTGETRNVQFRVINNGVAPLNGSIDIPAEAQSWLSTSNGAFNGIAAGGNSTLSLTLGGSSVNPGNYKATVNVNTNDPAHAQIPVNVYFYVRNEIAEQETNVVLEEATGTWCGWCPDGHRALAEIADQLGHRLISLAYHGPTGSGDPFVFQQGYNLLQKLGTTGYPSAGIQRWFFPGEKTQMTSRNAWETYINAVLQLQPNAPMALEVLEYKYNTSTKEVTAKVKATSAMAIPMTANTKFRITAVVVQDSIPSRQTEYIVNPDNTVSTVYREPYMQRHAVRGLHPDETGLELVIPDGGTEENVLLPGTSMTQDITFTANTTDPSKTHVVFLVHRTELGNTLREIYQGHEMPLTANISSGGVAVNTATSTMLIPSQDTAAFETTVKNNGTSPAQLTISRTQNQLPNNDWSSWFCVGDNCTSTEQTTLGPITVAPGETKTVTVHIKGATQGTGTVTLHFDGGNGNTSDQVYTATVQSGSGVNDPVAGASGLHLSVNTPNPASTITSFNYALPLAGAVTIELFSMTGEKITTINEPRMEAGAHSFDLNVSSLPSGKYTVRLTANGSSVSRLVTVTR